MYKCINIFKLYSIFVLFLIAVFIGIYLTLFIYSLINEIIIKLRDVLFKKVKNK